jgi:transposase
MQHGSYQRTMAMHRAACAADATEARRSRPAAARTTRGAQRHLVGFANWRALERLAREISSIPNLPSPVPAVDPTWRFCPDSHRTGRRFGATRKTRPDRGLYRRLLLGSKKRGDAVGKTKRGKGSKIMAIADSHGLPIAACVANASPHEVTLVEETLDAAWTQYLPKRLIGDKAYDSDVLDVRLLDERGVDLISPNRSNRLSQTQDGRKLRRYRRRWKIERVFAWLHNFRRLVVRYEYHAANFLGMLQLGCIVILLRHF